MKNSDRCASLSFPLFTLAAFFVAFTLYPAFLFADGKIFRPRNYKGSLEELSQEAIIVFHSSKTPGEATEDLILKIRVAGETDEFAWVIPFPNIPEVEEEKAVLFRELFQYVQKQNYRLRNRFQDKSKGDSKGSANKTEGVRVHSREIVGSYDVAVVEEKNAGALNDWLEKEGYQGLENAEDVMEFYRKKNYVFACIKVSDAALQKRNEADLHPLRFRFKTGGRDGIYFPMKMTGLQNDAFDVNLYVFYRSWINDSKSKFGYENRGFRLVYRDWDTKECKPNGGKDWSNPTSDPLLARASYLIPNTRKFFQKNYPGDRFYLTNIQANGLDPRNVRDWPDDLWLFPYYTNPRAVPFDAYPEGVASAGWPNQRLDGNGNDPDASTMAAWDIRSTLMISLGIVAVCVIVFLTIKIQRLKKAMPRS